MESPARLRLLVVTACEWLMLVPAGLFFTAAALRLLQPRQYEPARTAWIICEWAFAHVTRPGAAILFLGLPGLVAAVGSASALQTWRQDEALRHDAREAIAVLRRQLPMVLMAAATISAAAIVAFVVIHVIIG